MGCLLFYFHLQLQETIIFQFNDHFRIEDNLDSLEEMKKAKNGYCKISLWKKEQNTTKT